MNDYYHSPVERQPDGPHSSYVECRDCGRTAATLHRLNAVSCEAVRA